MNSNHDRGPRPKAEIRGISTSRHQPTMSNGAASHPCVYRMFAADGTLLYIGVSLTVLRRMQEHQSLPWYQDVASIAIEHKETKEAAYVAEKLAIYDEQPRYNLYHTGEYEYFGVKAARARGFESYKERKVIEDQRRQERLDQEKADREARAAKRLAKKAERVRAANETTATAPVEAESHWVTLAMTSTPLDHSHQTRDL